MAINRTALWIVLVGCALVGAVYGTLREHRSRTSPHRAIERYLVAALTGAGAGMVVATLVLFAEAALARLLP